MKNGLQFVLAAAGLSGYDLVGGNRVTLRPAAPLHEVILHAREDNEAIEGNETFQLQLVPQNRLSTNEFVMGPINITIVDTTCKQNVKSTHLSIVYILLLYKT